jgi:hypothetical protein
VSESLKTCCDRYLAYVNYFDYLNVFGGGSILKKKASRSSRPYEGARHQRPGHGVSIKGYPEDK